MPVGVEGDSNIRVVSLVPDDVDLNALMQHVRRNTMPERMEALLCSAKIMYRPDSGLPLRRRYSLRCAILSWMPKLDRPFSLPLTIFGLLFDAFRFIRLSLQPRCILAAENLFLRKQLAPYLERRVKPRRAETAAKLTLVLLSRLFPWRQALTVVKPETFIRWHRKGFRLFWK